MRRKRIKILQHRLEDAVKEAEKNGPLSNFTILWDKVCSIYNKDLPHAVLPISPIAAKTKAKEWIIPIRTKAGKIGRQSGQSFKSGISIFCSLGDFVEHTVNVGKFAGNVFSTRPALAIDAWCWVMTYEKKDGEPDSFRKFYPSLASIQKAISENIGGQGWIETKDISIMIGNVAKCLEEKTGIPLPKDFDSTLPNAGKILDDLYQTNFHYHNKIYKRLTGEDTAEDTENTEEETQ